MTRNRRCKPTVKLYCRLHRLARPQRLNARGVPMPAGGPWHAVTVRRALQWLGWRGPDANPPEKTMLIGKRQVPSDEAGARHFSFDIDTLRVAISILPPVRHRQPIYEGSYV
jgi:hypothetical protein